MQGPFGEARAFSVAGETSIIAGMAGRYANALFELARDKSELERVETDLKGFLGLLDESDDLKRLVASPVFSAEIQENAVSAIADKAGFGDLTKNLLHVIARNRRLSHVEDIIKGFKALLASHRGEVTAEATSAVALTDDQKAKLKASLKEVAGQDIELITKVDASILGGLIVKIGSQQIDDSLRTKLNNINKRMKEVS